VTHAIFTYVALDDSGRPIPVLRGSNAPGDSAA
jgi:acyl-CoA hydrolase